MSIINDVYLYYIVFKFKLIRITGHVYPVLDANYICYELVDRTSNFDKSVMFCFCYRKLLMAVVGLCRLGLFIYLDSGFSWS